MPFLQLHSQPHVSLICSAMDDLPLNVKVLLQFKVGESGPSQNLESHHLSDYDTASLDEADS
jgi:hypothetical protein